MSVFNRVVLAHAVASITIRDIPKDRTIQLATPETLTAQCIRDTVDGAARFDSFFVEMLSNGIGRVWGFLGCVPELRKDCYKLR